MDKTQLLELEQNSHFSIVELRETKPDLAKSVDERLEKRAQQTVVAQLGGRSEKLRKLAATVKIPKVGAPEKTRLREFTVMALREAVAGDPQLADDAEIKKELEQLAKTAILSSSTGAKDEVTLGQALLVDQPIALNPEFRLDLEKARLYRLADATGLPEKTAKVLVDEFGRVASISDGKLKQFVSERKLSAKAAKEAGLASSFYHLLDERPELVAAARVGSNNLGDLVKNDRDAWVKIITDSKTTTPAGIAVEDYAELLSKKVERRFPAEAIAHRLSKEDAGPLLTAHAGLSELRKLNPKTSLIGHRDFRSLETKGIAPSEVEKLKQGYEGLVKLTNRYPGMRLDTVLDNESLSDANKVSEVSRRMNLVNDFFAKNEQAFATDLTPRSPESKNVKFAKGVSPKEKTMVLSTIRAYQRTQMVTDDVAHTEALVSGGFHSALGVANAPIEAIVTRTGLKYEIAEYYKEKAKGIASAVTPGVGSILDLVAGSFAQTAVGNVSSEIADYLKEIPGYADFFGNQDFCNCTHCQSILSPAAYFVDLMDFIDAKVTPIFQNGSHPLKLSTRRPDLWNLELTCENTNKEIPYLVIINEILENAVAREVGFDGDFGDRPAVSAKVYQRLLDRVDSFSQPLYLPFEEIRTYLRHFKRTLADVAEAGKASGADLARLRLGLSPRAYNLITAANEKPSDLSRIYGIKFPQFPPLMAQRFNAQEFLRPMGVSREELGELIVTRFVRDTAALSIRIISAKGSPQSIQNDIEHVEGLTAGALDRMHRFVRLRRATGWRIGELDLVLVHLKRQGLGSNLDPAMLHAVATVHRLQVKYQISVEEFIALWSTVPSSPVLGKVPSSSDGVVETPSVFPQPTSTLARLTKSLFNRLFNQTPFVEVGGEYPQPLTMFLHPALAAVPPTSVDPNLHRLQIATGTDDDQFYQLIVGLAFPLGIDLKSADDNQKKFGLSGRNLSLLYRHARLAALLSVSIPELFALAALTPEIDLAYVEKLADLEPLFRLKEWWKTTQWSMAELLETVQPGLPAIATSDEAFASKPRIREVSYNIQFGPTLLEDVHVEIATGAGLADVIDRWNKQTSHSRAYRSDSLGIASNTENYLSIKTLERGARSRIRITSDGASIFRQSAGSLVPVAMAPIVAVGAQPTVAAGLLAPVFVGADVPERISRPEIPSSSTLASELVDQVSKAKLLEFADTVFKLLPPQTALAASTALTATAAGAVVTYDPILNGRAEASETITFAANATIVQIVADWNSKAKFTLAVPVGSNGFLVLIKGAGGSNTRLIITADSAQIFGPALSQGATREYRGTEITETQSRAIIKANSAIIESAGSEEKYWLKSSFDPTALIALPRGINRDLNRSLRDVLNRYHSKKVLAALLPSRVGVSPDIAAELLEMLDVDLNDAGFFRELRGDSAPTGLATLIGRLQRLAGVFSDQGVFQKDNLKFVGQHASLFGVKSFDRIEIPELERIEMFRKLIDAGLARPDEAPDLKSILLKFKSATHFGGANQEDLAAVLDCDRGLLQSVHSQIKLSKKPFAALGELMSAVTLAKYIGIGGSALKLIQSTKYPDLAAASAALQAAFRARYEDEAEWEKNIEPFRDALLSVRRDGLVAYLLHSSKQPFDEVSDLYHYFLLDVQLEGCVRTSRVASAIDTLHLYVQRCLMNLEETPPGDKNPARVAPNAIPPDEWAWRKSYRVWEANRKIFLYPENYLEPELRDDKTPLFETLEEDLLSKEITDEAVLEAYSRYLRGFDELAHLTIAGSYHEKDDDNRHDVLHLLGVTSDDPPVYYYRRVDDAHYGVAEGDRATYWGAWEKLNIQVPVRVASPLVHKGQLYIFWIRYVTKPQSELDEGSSEFVGYRHQAFVEFAKRKLDGSWTTPQKLRLNNSPFTSNDFPPWYQGDGVILDPLVPDAVNHKIQKLWGVTIYEDYQPLYDDDDHQVPKEDYTLRGFNWERLYPATGSQIYLRGADFQMWSPVDLYRLEIGERIGADNVGRYEVPTVTPPGFVPDFVVWPEFLGAPLPARLLWSEKITETDENGFSRDIRRDLHTLISTTPCFDTYTFASVLVDKDRVSMYRQRLAKYAPNEDLEDVVDSRWDDSITDDLRDLLEDNEDNTIGFIGLDTNLEVVNGSVGDVIIQSSKDVFYLQTNARPNGKCNLRRLNTSLSEDVARILFQEGIDRLLATTTQMGLSEHETNLNLDPGKVHDATKTGEVDFQGAMGVYLREIFFHIPFLIANHLNSQGRFDDAQRWYHYIFDPTASEVTNPPRNRNWRYREFRALSNDSLRAQLTDDVAIEKYKRDPFNPHAIARLRLTAYQKAIVMKYVDNLLDAGDDLFARAFAQLNPEYLREATLKYVTAQEILGARPARLGDCGEGKLSPKNYATITKSRLNDEEFLMEVESLITSQTQQAAAPPDLMVGVQATDGAMFTALTHSILNRAKQQSANGGRATGAVTVDHQTDAAKKAPVKAPPRRSTTADLILASNSRKSQPVSSASISEGFLSSSQPSTLNWGSSLLFALMSISSPDGNEKSPVFCVPGNEKMLGYWDRVEARLYNLRHCRDIDGVFRQLPLFAPPIDPGLLAAAQAAGLSLDDALSASAGNLPPYRFRFLIEKARSFVSTVQSFGAALLSALEKRDVEELAALRNVHEKNILTLTTDLRTNEVKIAEESLELAIRRQVAAEYRHEYYSGLIATGMIGSETARDAAQLVSMGFKGFQGLISFASGIAYLVPQLGSPLAMKYGGKNVGDSLTALSDVAGFAGQLAEMTATVAGMVAGYERREQEWKHQKSLAQHDLKASEKDVAIATLRRAMETRSLELHEKAKAQHDEVMDLFGAKFSNLGLYTHLSRNLQQLHRDAYNTALTICQLAEDAYHFERSGDNTRFIGGEWDSSRAGLLAGERLQMALHNMEKRFIETDKRQAEINQSFSIGQVYPQALIDLRELGSCEFAIREFYFDLFYPGQYRRRIQAVRLTIPCVTGPYTNVSARLTLLNSAIRKEPVLGALNLIEVPPNRTASVAMSTGQADAGVFELNFRDEHYMPFEGAGAVSEWRLEFPSHFKPFDYHTISDVVLSISYTAEEDDGLRGNVEQQLEESEGSLKDFLKNNTLTRVFSLRQDFSTVFNQLLQSASGTAVTFEITDRHFPLFLQGRTMTVAKTTIVLALASRTPVGPVSISVNGKEATFPNPSDAVFAGLPSKSLDAAFTDGLKRSHTIVVNNAGALASAGVPVPLLDSEKLRDILLVIEYRCEP